MHRKIVSFQIIGLLKPFAGDIVRTAAEERERWPLWWPVGLAVGIGVYFAWPHEPAWWTGVALAAGLTLTAHVLNARNLRGVGSVLALLAACALGFGVGGARTWWVAEPALAEETGPVTVTGRVVELEPRPRGPRITLENLTIQRLAPSAVPARVRVSLSGRQPQFAPGDWVRLTASLAPPPSPAAPGAFDFQRQSYFRGLGGVGFAYGSVDVTDRPELAGGRDLVFRFKRLRLGLAERVRAHIPGDPGRVASALVTGERSQIPEHVLDDLRASGLAHLLAISGLHVGLVAGIVFFWLRLALAAVPGAALGWPVKKLAAAAAMAAALFYALLAGWTVPTQRAFLMVALVLLAVLLDRRALSMRTVALAAGAILCLTPEALLGASFQMSFAAVVALVAVYETLNAHGRLPPAQTWPRRIARYGLGVGLTTAVAGAATATFAAYHFNRVADFGMAANIIAVPLMALWVMPLAVAAFALMPFGLEALALVPMGWGVGGVLAVAHEVASWPGAQRMVPAFPVWGMALVALGGVWMAIWRGPWRRLGVISIFAGLLATAFVTPPDVLIDATGRLAAVRTPDGGYAVSTLSAKRFERDVWLRRAGLESASGRWQNARLAESGPPRPGRVRCDALGCIYAVTDKPSAAVAFARVPEALDEDCRRARVLVNLSATASPASCRAVHVIDLGQLSRGGAHALWFENDGNVRVQSVNEWRGRRPWVVGAKSEP